MIIEIRIANKKYQLNCRENEQGKILEYADLLDQRITELKEDLTDVGNENLLVIAGIMLEKELQEKKYLLQDEQKQQLFNEDDLYDALSEQMDNITSFIEKISKKIENL
ncbi:MAG: cell division protein ZapA [Alphaproteobacteria bacterium]